MSTNVHWERHYVTFAVTWEQSDARQPELFIWHKASQRFLNLGKDWKQADPLFYKVYIYFLGKVS